MRIFGTLGMAIAIAALHEMESTREVCCINMAPPNDEDILDLLPKHTLKTIPRHIQNHPTSPKKSYRGRRGH